MHNQPIGIIDSGVGGLTIWQEIAHQLPHESVVYIADSKNCPYGDKTPEHIYALAKKLIAFLVAKDVKLIVIACNTITVTCLDKLRNDFPSVPIVGTVPVVKLAATLSHKRSIGVLSTRATSKSQYQKQLIAQFAADCEVVTVGTDKLVPLVEAGKTSGKEVKAVLAEVLAPFRHGAVDVLVLGCTHFPFLKAAMQGIVGEHVRILDSAGAIARQVHRVLEKNGVLASQAQGKYVFYTTGESGVLQRLLQDMDRSYTRQRVTKTIV